MIHGPGRKLVIALGLGGGLLIAGAWLGLRTVQVRKPEMPVAPASGPTLIASLRSGDARAVQALRQQAVPAKDVLPDRLDEGQAIEWIERLTALRSGLAHLPPESRPVAIDTVLGVLARFTVDGTPAGWSKVLSPAFDVLIDGLNQPAAETRVVTLDAVARLWTWAPGCTMTPAEAKTLGAWKEGLYPLVVRRLADPEPPVRQRAILALAALPIESKAAPAIAYLNDANFTVRMAVLTGFASRSSLLTEEAILPLLHDPVPELAALAEHVLKTRGLSPDLIGLGRMVTHERPEMRASSIPELLKHDDIDPVVWLLRLSEDDDERVRLKSAEALGGRDHPDAQQRLREMAAADDSPAVRAAAAKLVPVSKTVALPPLPGSPSLFPKAN